MPETDFAENVKRLEEDMAFMKRSLDKTNEVIDDLSNRLKAEEEKEIDMDELAKEIKSKIDLMEYEKKRNRK